MNQCQDSRDKCKLLNCAFDKKNNCKTINLMQMFQNSNFCLQPTRDSFTRRSTFDSILTWLHPWGNLQVSHACIHFPYPHAFKKETKYSIEVCYHINKIEEQRKRKGGGIFPKMTHIEFLGSSRGLWTADRVATLMHQERIFFITQVSFQ